MISGNDFPSVLGSTGSMENWKAQTPAKEVDNTH
jgi:hypothetical protein